MPEEVSIRDRRSLTRLFPALRLVGAIRQAFDLRKLIIAALGLVLLQPGWTLLDRLVPATADTTPDVFAPSIASVRTDRARVLVSRDRCHGFISGSRNRSAAGRPLCSLSSIRAPAGRGCCTRSRADVVDRRLGNLRRRDLPDRDRASRRESAGRDHRRPPVRAGQCRVRSSWPRFVRCSASPFCAWSARHSGCFTVCRWSGPRLAGIGLFFPLAAGLVMTLFLAGLVAGWPLLQAATAGGAEDALDALSRSSAT